MEQVRLSIIFPDINRLTCVCMPYMPKFCIGPYQMSSLFFLKNMVLRKIEIRKKTRVELKRSFSK
ncbi:MAG: hypothetical protein GPJ51_15790 [Candidatus Heimdallarchaeota archaeon]|nr:hypothetical protein [Candidatus Heimdallarchaeota archaeon]